MARDAAWEVVVGIETHAQLATRSKMFSGAATAFGAAPNTQASAVDLALPGTLPVANRAAIEHAIRFGLAVSGTINRRSIFARKNYFYPDLPKGYQVSQYETPIVQGGEIRFLVGKEEKCVRLTRAHLEEDAGKSLHEDFHGMTGIDLNRAGTPLLEIVSEPDLRGAEDAVAYAKKLHSLVTWIGICDGNMEEGSFRCDANVSVRHRGDPKLGTRCEIKNLNSFRFMDQAIRFEVSRQIEILESGGTVVQETRLFDPDRNETRPMRSKEDAPDYRYFADPDLLPLVITDEQITQIRADMPEGRDAKKHRYAALKIPVHTADLLLATRDLAEYFDASVSAGAAIAPIHISALAQSTANTVVSVLSSHVNDAHTTYRDSPLTSEELARIEALVFDGTISRTAQKELIKARFEGKADSIEDLIEILGLRQISDLGVIEDAVDKVLKANSKQVEDYRAGKERAFNSLVGQVMKATGGKANPTQVNELLRRKLK